MSDDSRKRIAPGDIGNAKNAGDELVEVVINIGLGLGNKGSTETIKVPVKTDDVAPEFDDGVSAMEALRLSANEDGSILARLRVKAETTIDHNGHTFRTPHDDRMSDEELARLTPPADGAIAN